MLDNILSVEDYKSLNGSHRTEMACFDGRAKVQITLTPVNSEVTHYETLLIGTTESESRTVALKDEHVPHAEAVEALNRWVA